MRRTTTTCKSITLYQYNFYHQYCHPHPAKIFGARTNEVGSQSELDCSKFIFPFCLFLILYIYYGIGILGFIVRPRPCLFEMITFERNEAQLWLFYKRTFPTYWRCRRFVSLHTYLYHYCNNEPKLVPTDGILVILWLDRYVLLSRMYLRNFPENPWNILWFHEISLLVLDCPWFILINDIYFSVMGKLQLMYIFQCLESLTPKTPEYIFATWPLG